MAALSRPQLCEPPPAPRKQRNESLEQTNAHLPPPLVAVFDRSASRFRLHGPRWRGGPRWGCNLPLRRPANVSPHHHPPPPSCSGFTAPPLEGRTKMGYATFPSVSPKTIPCSTAPPPLCSGFTARRGGPVCSLPLRRSANVPRNPAMAVPPSRASRPLEGGRREWVDVLPPHPLPECLKKRNRESETALSVVA